MQRFAVQQTPAAQAFALQFAVQTDPAHFGAGAQLFVPVQWTSDTDAVALTPPVHELTPPHEISHAPEMHSTGAVQERSRQVTSQRVPRQAMLPEHVLRLTHPILHVVALLQSIVPLQLPSPLHRTSHGTPFGQTIGVVHEPASAHRNVQVPPSHVPPAAAHTAAHAAAAPSSADAGGGASQSVLRLRVGLEGGEGGGVDGALHRDDLPDPADPVGEAGAAADRDLGAGRAHVGGAEIVRSQRFERSVQSLNTIAGPSVKSKGILE